ncbi:hypothetical protein P7B02_14905 [Caulobacter segnis]|uniref:hypothetical protein n=1 Tax=Caulobacter segnis TaxID=88688 RepID=UPI00240F142F|nr:hypothetical protein [Caulobacter segnis]MDG2522826.1 hypothetical protein [Caulobacter segnis]
MKRTSLAGGLILAVIAAIAAVIVLGLFYVLGAAIGVVVFVGLGVGLIGLILYGYARLGRRGKVEENQPPVKLP